MKIKAIDVSPWDVPLRAPYRSAQRVSTTAHNVLVWLRLEDGTLGWGESAPAAYVTGETQNSVVAAVRSTIGALIGQTPENAFVVIAERLASAPGARAALETALADAQARTQGVPLCRQLGAPANGAFGAATDLSLPILSPAEAGERAARAGRDGFRTLKIKVGCGDENDDLARVRAVAEAAPDAQLRLDGNQGFAPDQAVRFIDRLAREPVLAARIELLEQPTPSGDDAALAFVSHRIPYPVFADESAQTAEDAQRLVGSRTCAGVVLKLAKSGLFGAAEIARVVDAAGGKCLFGCMLETRIAIGAALHLVLALGPLVTGLDLDGHLLVDDAALVTGGLRQNADTLIVDPAAPGLGLIARVSC